jgi:hypothetical protein
MTSLCTVLSILAKETFAGCPANVSICLRHLEQVVEGEAVDSDVVVGAKNLRRDTEGHMMVRVGERHARLFWTEIARHRSFIL